MSFKNPYQKSTGKKVHRASRKAAPSATKGFINPRRYRSSKEIGMSKDPAHLQIIVNGVHQVDSVVESMEMNLDCEGNVSLVAKQPRLETS